jgi:uncharacterized protein (TIGR02996 family)
VSEADTCRALLRAVLEDPADDLPRLALADWWEEEARDPDRAEFVRAQIELAARGCVDVWCEKISRENYPVGRRCELADGCDALRLRERDLLAAREWRWLHAPWRASAAWRWRRGFVEAATLPTADFLRLVPDLFKAQPVTEVTLTDKRPMRYATATRGACWRWFEAPPLSGHYGAADELPGELWRAYAERTQAESKSWVHPTEADALAALSRGAVELGRAAAGLGPLP